MKKLSSIVEEIEVKEKLLNESRPTDMFAKIGSLKLLPWVDKIISEKGMPDGFSAMVRSKDGNAYEIQIRPAGQTANYDEFTKNNEKRDLADERRKEIFGAG